MYLQRYLFILLYLSFLKHPPSVNVFSSLSAKVISIKTAKYSKVNVWIIETFFKEKVTHL